MHIKHLSKFRPKYGYKSWPAYGVEQTLSLKDCIEITLHLKAQAKIAENQAIWNHEKIRNLLQVTRKRKLKHAVISFLMGIFAIVSVFAFLLAPACLFSGNECAANFGGYINIAFGIAAFITVGLFLAAQNISRDKDDIQFSDYLATQLSVNQKQSVIQAILKHQREIVQLFERTKKTFVIVRLVTLQLKRCFA